ncbi:hypothetical protein V5O48_017701, partial [Marasmius crinis-equi]
MQTRGKRLNTGSLVALPQTRDEQRAARDKKEQEVRLAAEAKVTATRDRRAASALRVAAAEVDRELEKKSRQSLRPDLILEHSLKVASLSDISKKKPTAKTGVTPKPAKSTATRSTLQTGKARKSIADVQPVHHEESELDLDSGFDDIDFGGDSAELPPVSAPGTESEGFTSSMDVDELSGSSQGSSSIAMDAETNELFKEFLRQRTENEKKEKNKQRQKEAKDKKKAANHNVLNEIAAAKAEISGTAVEMLVSSESNARKRAASESNGSHLPKNVKHSKADPIGGLRLSRVVPFLKSGCLGKMATKLSRVSGVQVQ